MNKLACVASVLGGAILLSGCGTVKVESVRVPPGELSRYMAAPGIYYALPRSEITVAIPVTLERQTKGFNGNIIDACVAACSAGQADSTTPKACEIPTANDAIVLARPEIVRRELQDFDHLYRLNVGGGFLDGVTHAVAVAENGVLSEATSKVSDQTADLALGIVSQLGKIAATGLVKSAKTPTGLTCKDARAIASQEADFRKRIEEAERQRTEILVPKAGAAPALTADHAKLAAERLREQIGEIEAARDKFRAKQDLTEVKKTYKSRLVSQGLAPAENHALAPVRLVFRELVESETSEVLPMKIHDVLNDALLLHASVTPSVPAASSLSWTAKVNEPLVAGYRYRIPMPGVLRITCRGTASVASVCMQDADRTLIEQEVPIAQYGALATLPVEFKGKSATVGLALHPSTGGIKKVDLGVEPVGAKPILDTIDSLRTSQDARRAREEAAAQAAQDVEKGQLTRDRDLLKLKKEIRDLHKELGTTP
ncbi:MAG: DUF4831 family protein [Steroidobacteraceae bacterium]|nr:DUF4831 family protein [Steroidobacteraceae bacterium]